jgi:hypothetical protein
VLSGGRHVWALHQAKHQPLAESLREISGGRGNRFGLLDRREQMSSVEIAFIDDYRYTPDNSDRADFPGII